jgi:lipoic acid synthetase
MNDLLENGVKVMTIGQYLQPTRQHMPVEAYIPPVQFEEYGRIALDKGFIRVESSPLVRSSYHAERHVL